MIKKFCGADDKDALIFCGTGATTAINLLTNQMGVKNQVEYVKAREKMSNILSPE
jgi:selenocysteine lyase/cysteine desulfurase